MDSVASASTEHGFLVVASPTLVDPSFRRTVVLIISHDQQGSFGLVLNRPLERMLSDVLEQHDCEDSPHAAEVPLYQGGPVSTEMVQFVSGWEECGKLLLPGVAVGADLADLACASSAGRPTRAYAGYAGWGAGQLERETEEGSWIIAPAASRHVFDVDHDDLWSTVLRELGGSYAWMALGDQPPGDN
jgi:putative transcriptional regulator